MASIVVMISSDPKKNHRAVEAMRIALGLISGEHEVNIVLMDRAPLLLSEDQEDLIDGDILMKYLPSFGDLGQTFFVEEGALESLGTEITEYAYRTVSKSEIGNILRKSDHLMFFS